MVERYARLAPEGVKEAAMLLEDAFDEKPAKKQANRKRSKAPTGFVARRIHLHMNTIFETEQFSALLEKLRDLKGRARIVARISSARAGNFGGCKSVGMGVSEMCIDFGPGCRAYYGQEGLQIDLLILGGDKSSQTRDIAKAKEMWRIIREERQ